MKPKRNFRRIERRCCYNCEHLRTDTVWWCARDNADDPGDDYLGAFDDEPADPAFYVCDRWVEDKI
jgi:hypothetical protein